MTTKYKRQRLLGNGVAPSPLPSKYETSAATLKNFPSSIVSDVTAEGGLFSLTFKSVGYVKFVENLDLIRGAIVPIVGESVVINDLVKFDQEYLEKLKTEVGQIREQSKDVPVVQDDEITILQKRLQTQLDNKSELSGVGKDIVSLYEAAVPSRKLKFSEKEYYTPKVNIPVKVESIEDLENPDLSAYASSREIVSEPIVHEVPEIELEQAQLDPAQLEQFETVLEQHVDAPQINELSQYEGAAPLENVSAGLYQPEYSTSNPEPFPYNGSQ